jgi:hypothetical protein
MTTQMTKEEALAKHLGIELSEVECDSSTCFYADGKTYTVLTDYEADDQASCSIMESLWAFKPEFLEAHGVPYEVSKALVVLCEGANEALLKLIDSKEGFVSDVISSDGRGCFLNSYDGIEIELPGGYFAYRT